MWQSVKIGCLCGLDIFQRKNYFYRDVFEAVDEGGNVVFRSEYPTGFFAAAIAVLGGDAT